MSDKIDARVSQQMDPETFRAIEGHDDETAPFVGDVINAFVDIHHVLSSLHDARARAESNGALTPENRILEVSKVAEKHRDRVVSRLARTERDLRARIEHTEGELTKPLVERAGLGTLNGEVRDHFKGLDRAAREKLLREAMEKGDGLTLTAVLGGPYYLSGMTEIDHQHYVRELHERDNPHLVRRLDVMNRFLAMLERGVRAMPAQFDKAVGATRHRAATIMAADQRMHDALKIEPIA